MMKYENYEHTSKMQECHNMLKKNKEQIQTKTFQYLKIPNIRPLHQWTLKTIKKAKTIKKRPKPSKKYQTIKKKAKKPSKKVQKTIKKKSTTKFLVWTFFMVQILWTFFDGFGFFLMVFKVHWWSGLFSRTTI